MGAPLPVREYATAEEMMRRYKEVRGTCFLERPQFAPIPAPDRAVTVAAERRARLLAEASGDRLETLKILRICRVVSVVCGVPVETIKGNSRKAPHVKARQIATYLACRTGRALLDVAYYMGGRDHSTVLYSRNLGAAMASDLGVADCSDVVVVAQTLWDAPWTATSHKHQFKLNPVHREVSDPSQDGDKHEGLARCGQKI